MISGVAVNATVTLEEMASTNSALKTAIALENQCATSTDCNILPVGARACGGPSSFVAYSVKSSNIENIHSLAQLTTQLEQQYNSENSVLSMCFIAMPPSAVCDETKKCVTGPSSYEPDYQ